jgi:dsDNA-binding SOS-regulon protein
MMLGFVLAQILANQRLTLRKLNQLIKQSGGSVSEEEEQELAMLLSKGSGKLAQAIEANKPPQGK